MKSPKERFLKTPDAAILAEWVTKPAVLDALDAALLQMQWNIGASQDHLNAAAQKYQLDGARRFISEFLSLPEPPTKPVRPRGDNLEP
jgi:hypothetical protein